MTSGRPTISAIIPLFNGAAFIEDALNSVFAQTLPPDEIIVVDDGSADDGAALVERLSAARDVTLIRKENGGQSSARNLGIARATGDLIALLDQDDMWYPHHLEEMVKPFCGRHFPPLGWVYSNLDEVDRQGRMVARCTLRFASDVQHPKRDLIGCLSTDMFILPSASLISRDAILAVGGFDEALSGYEDDDLFVRLFRAGYDNIYIKEALTRWRIFDGSASFTRRMARSRVAYLKKLIAAFPDDPRAGRFFARDMLAPRFFPWLVGEYTAALRGGNPRDIEVALDDLMMLARLHKPRVRRTVALLHPALRLAATKGWILSLSRMARPVMRRVLR